MRNLQEFYFEQQVIMFYIILLKGLAKFHSKICDFIAACALSASVQCDKPYYSYTIPKSGGFFNTPRVTIQYVLQTLAVRQLAMVIQTKTRKCHILCRQLNQFQCNQQQSCLCAVVICVYVQKLKVISELAGNLNVLACSVFQ